MQVANELKGELHRIYLFDALNGAQLEKMIVSMRTVQLAARDALFQFRQSAERFYLLRKGQIKLFSVSENGDEKVVEIIHPGETFAEAVMFMNKHVYPVNAEAIVDSELYSFDMHVFRELLNDSRETCFHLLASMSRRLHARIDEISNLTLHNATYRLVVYLLQQLPEGAIELPEIHLSTPKSVIASRLSIQPETFSRILARLAKQGLLTVQGNDITMRDVSGLRKLL